jgi:hypothetical protein
MVHLVTLGFLSWKELAPMIIGRLMPPKPAMAVYNSALSAVLLHLPMKHWVNARSIHRRYAGE